MISASELMDKLKISKLNRAQLDELDEYNKRDIKRCKKELGILILLLFIENIFESYIAIFISAILSITLGILIINGIVEKKNLNKWILIISLSSSN